MMTSRNKKQKNLSIRQKSRPLDKGNQPKKNKSIFILLVILLLTVIVFSNSLNNDFIINWDDQEYIISNNSIKDISLQNLKTIFTTYYNSNYHPLTTLSYAIEYHFIRLNPRPYHVTNLIFHLFNVLFVFYLIFLLTRRIEGF